MINSLKYINEILLKKQLKSRHIFKKGLLNYSSYSITIVDRLENTKIKKVYGKVSKKERAQEKEKGNISEEADNPLIKRNFDLYKENKEKSIFYESERIIKCTSGSGGNGHMSFKKYKRKVFGSLGIPNGGKGGNGGSIYICYTNGKDNIKKKSKRNKIQTAYSNKDKYIYINNLNELSTSLYATDGENGKANQLRGRNGKSIFIYLNKICHVYELFSDDKDINNCDDNINMCDDNNNNCDDNNNNCDDNINMCDDNNNNCDDNINNCDDNINNCDDNINNCDDNINNCEDNINNCDDNINNCDDNINNCDDNINNCDDNINNCDDNINNCDDNINNCEDNINNCEDNINNCDDNINNCDDNINNRDDNNINCNTFNDVLKKNDCHIKKEYNYFSNYEKNVYNVLKKNDPVYIKRNNHILKEIMNIDKKVRKQRFIGILSENNNCILLAKGGEGGKGNNMNNTFSYENGKKGQVTYIKIVYKCISDICIIGYEQSGKSSILSLITQKIETANNLYILKKIYFADMYQISVADFFNNDKQIKEDKSVRLNEENKNMPSFYINENIFGFLGLTHLLVIVLDMSYDLIRQFKTIRNQLKRKDEQIYRKPYIVVINKCDVNFKEKIKDTEKAYNEIKMYDNDDVPIFFLSAKYGIGINEFVNGLRSSIIKLKKNGTSVL
ncbi:GTP-binding protein [Plasmodium falciparum NF54]|uniref:GTP-binding protein, putative n=2 Tax=Plasmodium falciparum TaxID=5833 RepID=C6KSS6_PLAF7|nr:GTP-binding protein, putative [Plasmodium falciparum 3D7]KAF4327687.1 GTP-binding protein [Plasmodium falciparum NF54]CAG25248.1 GTP-binding protein, putative [Plasmodium falciparum 3D7]|eukprot:XP_966068.1 GTP-binding protein, putative [Plasmodium falciparum 3D7]